MQEVMRKVVDTIDIIDNRIAEAEVEKLIDKLKVPELINQYQVRRINQSIYHQSAPGHQPNHRRFPAVVAKPKQSENGLCIVIKSMHFYRHVNNLIVVVPVDEHIAQPQPEVQGVQGDGGRLEQVPGQDNMVDRTEEKFVEN